MSTTFDFDTDRAVRFLQDFLRIDTTNPPGNEAAAADLLCGELSRFALTPETADLGSGRANVKAVLPGCGQLPSLLYNGHIDVVPVGETAWTRPPFGGEIHGGRLYGRGAADMKSGVAAMLTAVGLLAERNTRLPGDLVFSAVADEEVGGLGAHRFVSDGGMENTGAVVISEPTGFRLYVAEKGVYWVILETIGKTAHGAMPHLGRNAILDMQAVLNELTAVILPPAPDPKNGGTTMNIGSIHGGVSSNVVPDSCRLAVDVRIPPGVSAEAVMRELRLAVKNAAGKVPGMDVRFSAEGVRPPVETRRNARIVERTRDICGELFGMRPEALPTPGYATDAGILCHDPAVPFVIIGPGREELAHKPDEHVVIDDYLRSIELYRRLAERYFSRR